MDNKQDKPKVSKSQEDVVTIDIQPLILPFAVFASFLVLSISLLIGLNMVSSSIKEAGGITLGSGTGTGTTQPTAGGDLPAGDPTTGVTSIDDDPALGNRDAKVALVEFSDYNCGFCGRYHTDGTVDQIISNYVDTGDILYVYRDFPGVGGETTAKVASAAECIKRDLGGSDEDFFAFVKKKYANQQANDIPTLAGYIKEIGLDAAKFTACAEEEKYLDEVYADLEDGTAVGINGTPSFLVGTLDKDGNVDGELIIGAQSYDSFAAAIERQLAK